MEKMIKQYEDLIVKFEGQRIKNAGLMMQYALQGFIKGTTIEAINRNEEILIKWIQECHENIAKLKA